MPTKISDEKKQLIEELYSQGLLPIEISERAGVSRQTVYGYTRLKQRINPKTKQPFQSYGEYYEWRATQKRNPATGEPFRTLYDYYKWCAAQRLNPRTEKPFENEQEYRVFLATKGDDPDTGQPYKSIGDYRAGKALERAERPENQCLSDLIVTRLEELGKNQAWLAGEIGRSREMVSKYAQGKNIPSGKVLERLFLALDVPYKTIDDLLKDRAPGSNASPRSSEGSQTAGLMQPK
ncbi:MAG: helix-turn-helix domain-containing protein [Candidatus Woesearchaeota archaeon]